MSRENDPFLSELRELANQVPPASARIVREAAQRELDADQRAHDALVARGSQLLAAAGVAVGLLVGLTKEHAVDTPTERGFLILSLVAAAVAAVLIVIGTFITDTRAATDSRVAFGFEIPAALKIGENRWGRTHELRLAIHYCDARTSIRARHRIRANLLRAAQVCYAAFLILVAGLGMAIVF